MCRKLIYLVSVVLVLSVASGRALAGVAYPDPPDGWMYIHHGTEADNADGTWDHDNGSDAWDGSGIGAGQAGGISALVEGAVDFVRVQDALTSGDSRKIYLTRDLVAHDDLPQSVADGILSAGGITLSFRARLSTTPPLDGTWPAGGDGYVIHDGGKGPFGIYQAAGDQIISFGLVLAGDPQGEPKIAGRSGLCMNNLNGMVPSGAVDIQGTEAGTLNLLDIADLKIWHEFWITIQPDTSGGGTHKVTIWMDGSINESEFHVTAGDGNEEDYTYLAMGHGSSPQLGAIDADFFAYKPGIYMPPGGQKNASQPNPADGSAKLAVKSGTNAYMVLDYTPGDTAVSHTGYFSTVKADVDSRNAANRLGAPTAWLSLNNRQYVVGYDDAAIPAFARTPLVAGKTYYWCVDEFDGATTWPGRTWSFTVSVRISPINTDDVEQAFNPSPEDEAQLVVGPDVTLGWSLGAPYPTTGYILSYGVFWGTDQTAVATAPNTAPNAIVSGGAGEPPSYTVAGLPYNKDIFWRIDTRLLQEVPPHNIVITDGMVWSFTTGPRGLGKILREWWLDIPGTAVSALTSDPRYPDNPDGSGFVTLFEGPTNWQDDSHPYGSRIHGWLYVQNTGDYTFWIATDDNGELWLSTDENPANATMISNVTASAPARSFDDADVHPSGPIHLEGGRRYYISGLMKENTGGDNIAAAWQGPDSGNVREVIPGDHLRPFESLCAAKPSPANKQTDVALNTMLSWTTGTDIDTDSPYASQRVYLGTSASAVANADTSSPEYRGAPSGPNEYGPLSLGYYQNYFWRIDGVKGSGQAAKGSVWTFRTIVSPASASNPNPSDGATDVPRNTVLRWAPGDYAPVMNGHYVNFGADDPANMVRVSGPQTPNNYTPGVLDLGRTYYWAVDEANAAAPGGVNKGLTWSFTTINHIVIDDMETYVDGTTWIFNTWKDGVGDENCEGGNGTGAGVILSAAISYAGAKGMQYAYDNDGSITNPCSGQPEARAFYSKAAVLAAELPSGIGSNWTIGGAKALSLWFYGLTTNAIEPLWVQLTDASDNKAKVFYGKYADENPAADMNDPSWHEWLIDLAEFTGVSVSNVKSIAIGIGNEGGPAGGSGTLYFDDIRLYTSRCVLTRREAGFAPLDFAPTGGDCVINARELEVMMRDWLLTDTVIPPEPLPGGSNLRLHYKFEMNMLDSSANGLNGTAGGFPSYELRTAGDNAIVLAGSDYVNCGNPPQLDFSTGNWTVAAWIKPIATTDQHMIYCKGGDAAGGIRYMLTLAETNDHRMTVTTDDNVVKYQRHGDIRVDDGEWHHVLGMRDGTALRVYVDGADDGATTIPAGYDLSGTSQANAFIGANWNYETSVVQKFFIGAIDEVRIYNTALSQGQIVNLMGLAQLHIPVPSPAEIYEGEAEGSRAINFKDYAVLTDRWLEEDLFP